MSNTENENDIDTLKRRIDNLGVVLRALLPKPVVNIDSLGDTAPLDLVGAVEDALRNETTAVTVSDSDAAVVNYTVVFRKGPKKPRHVVTSYWVNIRSEVYTFDGTVETRNQTFDDTSATYGNRMYAEIVKVLKRYA